MTDRQTEHAECELRARLQKRAQHSDTAQQSNTAGADSTFTYGIPVRFLEDGSREATASTVGQLRLDQIRTDEWVARRVVTARAPEQHDSAMQ